MSAGLATGNSNAFLTEEFEKLGIDPEKDVEEFRKFQLATYSWAHFAEYFFHDPLDDSKPLRLELPQKAAINAIQFGYDYKAIPWELPKAIIPREVNMIWPRQSGKSTGVKAGIATAFCFMNRRYKIGCFSINENRAKDLLAGVKQFIELSPFKYLIETANIMEMTKIGGQVNLRSYPASEACLGESIFLGVIDEAASIPDKIIDNAILYTMRRVGERCVMLSTPQGPRGTFIQHYWKAMKTRPIICTNIIGKDEIGQPVYCKASFLQTSELMSPHMEKFRTYEFDPITLPSCPSCGEKKWVYGVGEIAVVPVDPFTCARNPDGTLKTKEQILKELADAGNTPIARQNLLGEITAEGASVFSYGMLERAVNPNLQNYCRPVAGIKNYVIGMDFGKVHDASVLNVMHADWNRKKFVFDYMYTIPAKYQTIDYHDIREDFLNIVKIYRPAFIVPDALGVGDSVVDEMYNDLRLLGLPTIIYSNKMPIGATWISSRDSFNAQKKKRKGFIMDLQAKIDLIENLSEGYGKRMDIEIPPRNTPEVSEFWEEMLQFGYDVTDSKTLRYGTQAYHDDRVIAHALAYWVACKRPFTRIESAMGE